MPRVRYESDAELLAEVEAPLSDYEREAIRRIRAADAAGFRIVLGEVGDMALWARREEQPDRILCVESYDGRNPHTMSNRVCRWARLAGVHVPGLT